jgi:hypothetical protein
MIVVEKILEEREKTHGAFADHAVYTQHIKTLIRSLTKDGKKCLTSVQTEALDMIAHKIGRILAGDPNHKDHWDDIAGYATLVSKELARQPEQGQDIPKDRQPVDKYKQFKV